MKFLCLKSDDHSVVKASKGACLKEKILLFPFWDIPLSARESCTSSFQQRAFTPCVKRGCRTFSTRNSDYRPTYECACQGGGTCNPWSLFVLLNGFRKMRPISCLLLIQYFFPAHFTLLLITIPFPCVVLQFIALLRGKCQVILKPAAYVEHFTSFPWCFLLCCFSVIMTELIGVKEKK